MSDKTKIEWADATANYCNGCSLESPGCTNCYAMSAGGRNLPGHPSTGLTKLVNGRHVWTGEIRTNDKVLQTVLGWKKPRAIFWNAHGDLFHDSVPDDVIDRQFAVMALTPQHRHMVLTKRPERMREYVSRRDMRQYSDRIVKACFALWRTAIKGDVFVPKVWPLPNVWLGTSVEDQKRADERIPQLLATPAAVRFLSCEPLLGPVDLRVVCNGSYFQNPLTGHRWHDAPEGQPSSSDKEGATIDWIIVGGESGPGARAMHPDWARSLRDQCAAAGVPFHFKQWGEWFPLDEAAREFDLPRQYLRNLFLCQTTEDHAKIGKRKAGRLLDGVQHDGVPLV